MIIKRSTYGALLGAVLTTAIAGGLPAIADTAPAPTSPDPIINPAGGLSAPPLAYIANVLALLMNIPVIPDAIIAVLKNSTLIIPSALPGAAMTPQGQSVPITLTSKNVEFFSDLWMQYNVVAQPQHGTLSGTGANLVYKPNPGFTGFDRFTFTATAPLQLVARSQSQVDIKVTGSYNSFESGLVRPLALSSDGSRLYAVNTPDNRLEVFDVTQTTPKLLNSVPVGMEPVAVSLRNNNEAWVVNTLSDDVSIVDLNPNAPYVKRTLQVGDEPQDVVFAGPGSQRAFITSAHRGQNSPSDPQLTAPGAGRADVWVFDALGVDQTVGEAKPLNILTLFGTPARGLAVSPDGSTVYAAIHKSGNQTTTVGPNSRALGANSTKCGKPGPTTELADQPDIGNLLGAGPCSGIDQLADPLHLRHRHAPNTGVIVQYNGTHWVDSYNTTWDDFVPFTLPDKDVFAIDANAAQPAVLRSYDHVGTQLFNIAVNPTSGELYVSNLDARNLNRFEGDIRVDGKLTVNGRFIYNQITAINPQSGQVLPRNLDKHLNDQVTLGSASDSATSLAMPLQMQVDNTGSTLYVAAFGSSEIGVFDVNQLEQDTFTPSASTHIKVSGGGPSGLVLDPARHRMFVATRFNDGISVIDTNARQEVATATMYNPEPDYIVKGRPFFYDARFASSKGDSSCSSCHAFGDMDGLAWDLGNPQDPWKINTRPYINDLFGLLALPAIHPLKGPMTTQSLRGLEFQGPQHWRGDREGSTRVNGESLEHAAFKEFRSAFTSLLARSQEPTEDQLNSFTDFIMQLRYPPNPIRNLDDSLTAAQTTGENVFMNKLTTGFAAGPLPIVGGPSPVTTQALVTCNSCHAIDTAGQRFGSIPFINAESVMGAISQNMKVPHLRNLYQKVGMFGMISNFYATGQQGPQISGFGFINDGSVDTLQHFFTGLQGFYVQTGDLPPLIDYLFVTDTGFAPIVGQQVTLSSQNPSVNSRLDLMVQQALFAAHSSKPVQGKCDLIAKAHVSGVNFGLQLQSDGTFQADTPSMPSVPDATLRTAASVPGNAITYTCVPAGAGYRMGIDRDEDGIVDAVDPVTTGNAQASITAFNPNAPTETDQPVDPLTNKYTAQLVQSALSIWPNFTAF